MAWKFAFTPFLPIIWIYTEGEGDGIESSYIFFTLLVFISSALACQNYITCSVCQALLEPTNTWNAFAEDSSKRMAFFVCILYTTILQWKSNLQLQHWMKSSIDLLLSISWMHNVAQWDFNPYKMSLWGRGSTWFLSLFRYTFTHFFSYEIGFLFYVFFSFIVYRDILKFY